MNTYELFKKLIEDDMLNLEAILIKYYKKININEKDIIVLSMLSRQEGKKSHLFNPISMSGKIGLDKEAFYNSLNSLQEKGYLYISNKINPKTNKLSEYFSLDNLYKRIVDIYLEAFNKERSKERETFEESIANLYEELFFNQMSPLEAELVVKWANDRQFTLEEIKAEMLNASKIGKNNLKYVDQKLIKRLIVEKQNKEYNESKSIIESFKDQWKK